MGSSRALVCATAFLLFSLSSASKDEHIHGQRDVTFDLDTIMQEMQQPESFLLQKEVDLSDLLDPKEFPIEQKIVSHEQYDAVNERGGSRPRVNPRGRRPSFGPRGFTPGEQYPVEFPPARPSSDNLPAICLHSAQRPRYPDSYFPGSGFGQQRRKASAINEAESWFSTCCQGMETWGKEVALCCATQAWELSVKSFCEEDSSVKDRLYHCCRKAGNDRLNCFHNDAPNPNYQATLEIPVPPLQSAVNFSFDPNTCQPVSTAHSIRGNRRKKAKTPSTTKKVDISFPPGRPSADVIESLCHNQKLRPLYTVKCLPGSGYEWLAPQAKTINRIERGFKQCCKKKQDVLTCADQKWREELNRFCVGGKGEDAAFQCCSAGDAANDRHDCFQNVAPESYYNTTSATEEISLDKVCDTHKIIKKKFPVGFPFKTLVNQCCPLSELEKTTCLTQKLQETSANLCSSKKTSAPIVRRCCRQPSQESLQCISKVLMDSVTKAANVLRHKKKKRCPLS